MLRLPRRPPKSLGPRYRRTRKAQISNYITPGAYLILNKNIKIHWVQFEALRIKLARALTAKRKLSRKNLHKQKKLNKKGRKITRHSANKRAGICYYGFPHLAYRVKGRGSRMGKGKGNITCWYYKGRAGHALLKFRHINYRRLQVALHKIMRLVPARASLYAPRILRWLTEWNIELISYMVTDWLYDHFGHYPPLRYIQLKNFDYDA